LKKAQQSWRLGQRGPPGQGLLERGTSHSSQNGSNIGRWAPRPQFRKTIKERSIRGKKGGDVGGVFFPQTKGSTRQQEVKRKQKGGG